LFWALSQGGRLCLPEGEDHRDPARLATLIERADISHFLALPSLHAQLLGELGNHHLACAIVAGEACPAELPRTHAARLPGATLVNEYGPTEGSVWCTGWRADLTPDEESMAIGRPIPGARIHILDAALEPVPIGIEGEIYVAGAGVARGYLQRPTLTAERFVPDPYGVVTGERLYRTGDLGRYRPDGVIEYRGRIDQQVKIRGFRIELGEIEAALRRCDGVADVAVIARTTPAVQELVGFVVAGDPQAGQPSLDDLRATLADALPAYMLPARLRRLEQLPHTPNGKLDRNALEALDASRRDYVAPRIELERTVAAVWADALAVERVGVHDNFFELGGHSLLATKLRSRLQTELNVALPLRFFFEGETLEQFAAKIAAYGAGELDDARIDALETLFAEAEAR
jgi:acyl-coenzyme A synthetase/AMP-(fatty) acid ligase